MEGMRFKRIFSFDTQEQKPIPPSLSQSSPQPFQASSSGSS